MTTDGRSAPAARTRIRLQVRVEGIVQGVGFRPYVHGLATELGLGGFVGNDARGVIAEVEGDPAVVDEFVARLPIETPPLAVIEHIETRALDARGQSAFAITLSDAAGVRAVAVAPDVATCADCLAELWDPTDRRFHYPFINCTNCGPRYTIVRDVPYDRPSTTMAAFALCDECAHEYHDPADRRFHAQPVCCSVCGPHLTLRTSADRAVDGDPVDGDAIAAAARLLHDGAIVAIKGLGGYHLAVDATDETAVARLRARKHREERPFAVMVADLDATRSLCEVERHEAALLTGPAAPIVLLRRREGADAGRTAAIASPVAPGNRSLGVLLPYTPLHHLLAAAVGRPFVLTSGNISDEPIAHTDADARERLGGIADAFLVHDRSIHMRVDDSVVRVVGDRPLVVRRSRGYAPRPVVTAFAFPRPVLAVGAELKNTVCAAKQRRAYLSHHIGDLENYETHRSFVDAIDHLQRLFDVTPTVIAHDLHPQYHSTAWAVERDGVDLVGVQHHHAHIASCLADNGHPGPAIGVAFDGTGFGTDGTIWGGEILVADLTAFRRVGYLEQVGLPGGAAAIREPWRMAVSWLHHVYGDEVPDGLAVAARHRDRWAAVDSVVASGVHAPVTSSAGRLFDAVAALVGVRDRVSYEGQAAIELEQLADTDEPVAYPVRLLDHPRPPDGQAVDVDAEPPAFAIGGADLIRGVVDDLQADVAAPTIAARFHNGVVAAIVAACRRVREMAALETVALSGGVFQNVLLVDRTVAALQDDGFRVLTHRQVPPNDGGISLGQAAVAAAQDGKRA